jgi:L-fucose isomerase-like protein
LDEDEARQSVEQFAQRDPDLLLIIPLRGRSAPVIETAARSSPTPCLIWPIQGRFALPSSTLAVGALRESGFPVELVYAPPDTTEVIETIQFILKAAKAFVHIQRSRIGVIGELFPNLVSCRYDPQIVTARLGATLLPIPFAEIRDSMQTIANQHEEMERLRLEITTSFQVQPAQANALDAGMKLHLALKQIAREKKIDGFATECWSGFPAKLGLNPCLGFVEDAYTLACEGDVMLCISLLMVRSITGSSAYVGDLYDLDLDGNLTLIHCGAPASLAAHKERVEIVKSQLALESGFETMTCRPYLDPGPVTIFRFYGRNCDKMHVATGNLFDCDPSTNLTVRLRLAGNRQDFLKECFGNHYIVAAGDIRNELAQLCKWFGITIILS